MPKYVTEVGGVEITGERPFKEVYQEIIGTIGKEIKDYNLEKGENLEAVADGWHRIFIVKERNLNLLRRLFEHIYSPIGYKKLISIGHLEADWVLGVGELTYDTRVHDLEYEDLAKRIENQLESHANKI